VLAASRARFLRIAGRAAAGIRRAVAAGMISQASTLVTLAIPGLALVVVAVLGLTIRRYVGGAAAARFALAASCWLAFTALLGLNGFLRDSEALPPRMLLVFLPMLGLPVLLAFSRIGQRLASAAPVALLVGFQSFRFPLELAMHRAATEGTMPPQMSYSGSNFDILTGLTALLVAGVVTLGYAPRWLLLAWNALGSALLVAIMVIAVASLPSFQAYGSEPHVVNTWVASFPFVWLPAGLVTSALLGHLLLWRRLLSHGMRGRALSALS
jgi:hypothetical protein